jgi:hypothetical protein
MLGACGYTDGGDGTDTLAVLASATYSLAAGSVTYSVEVQQNEVDVEDATVTLSSGDWSLALGGSGGGYLGEDGEYRRALRLEVARGQDSLWGKLEGPGPHRIEAPANGANFAAGAVDVVWATDDGVVADTVLIHLQKTGYITTVDDDTGSFTIPAAGVVAGSSQALTVRRQNRVDLQGGAPGSFFTVGYEVRNVVNIQ